MKTKLSFIFLLACKICFSQDLVSDGSNRWILHTPDDGRTTMFVAPWVNNEYAWWLSTQFLNNGDVHFSGTITTPAKLGIGINPTASLHVSTPTGDLLVENSGIEGAYVTVHSGRFNRPAVTIYKQAGTEFWHTGILYDEAGNQKYSIGTSGSFSSSKLTIQTDGSVGIGTNTPSDIFQIGDFNNASNNRIKIPGAYNFEQVRLGQYGNGNCGLELVNHSGLTSSYGVKLMADIDEVPGFQIQIASPSNAYNSLAYSTKLFINLNGNVGIGTTEPGNYRLNVAGSIRADAIVCNTTGADFVFEPTYKLRPLDEVETFIKQNKHLPNVAPAAEMQTNGVSMGEMQAKLLEKVEELTLYSIEQDKAKEELKVKVEEQNKQLQEQRQSSIDLQQQLTAQSKQIEQLKLLITQKLKP